MGVAPPSGLRHRLRLRHRAPAPVRRVHCPTALPLGANGGTSRKNYRDWWSFVDLCYHLRPPRDSSPQFGDRHLFEIRATPMGSNPRAFHKKASPRDSLHNRTWRREGDSGPLRSPSPRGLAAPCALRWQTAPPFPQLRALTGSNPRARHKKASRPGSLRSFDDGGGGGIRTLVPGNTG